jgi:hypothetical protein
MVKIQELNNLLDYFRSSSEDLTRLLTPDRASPVLLLLNQIVYKWRTTKRVWCVNFHCEGVFIGVNGTSTDSGFSYSCRRVAMKARAEPPQTLTGRPRSWAGRPTPRPTRPRVWPTWSMCQIHPRGDDDFGIWSISLCHPLKCSNLVLKFLKSNKH